jgi:hypothetical protein
MIYDQNVVVLGGETAMKLVAEFKTFAAECQKIAQVLDGTEYKRPLVEMAIAWELLACEREAMLAENPSLKITTVQFAASCVRAR